MSRIIIKTNDNDRLCLFDTVSEKFFKNGCAKDMSNAQILLDAANKIAKKTSSYIVSMASEPTVNEENGYLDYILAREFLRMNPEIRDMADGSTDRRKKSYDKKEWNPDNPPKKRGRPPKKK